MDFIRQLEELSEDELQISDGNYHEIHYQKQLQPDYHNSRADQSQYGEFPAARIFDVNSSRSYEPTELQNEDFTTLTSNTSNIIHHTSSSNIRLVPTTVLSDNARGIFRFAHFNKMQSLSFNSVYKENGNCVVSSPTGSGKTVLFELAVLRLLNTGSQINNLKILYVAPTKALCIERQKDWNSKFSSFGLTVGTLTSDTSFIETDQVKRCNIIITTPEKWDLMTRKWTDYSKLFGMIKLLLIDEIHILRENRGSTLEVVVTRMKKICSDIRVIALSATIPNIHDLSGWIKLNSSSQLNAVTLIYGEEFRPVKLSKVIYGYKQTANDFVFDSVLNSKLVEVIHQHSESKPVLVFCPTRNSTIMTAKYIAEHYNGSMDLKQPLLHIHQRDLFEMSKQGVSFHHAGISLEDRDAVEKNFICGRTKILCSTSTLAVGVNLPAYLVVIKGTKIWNTNQFDEYSELDILQMMGRAGRPQFETQGKAVLMTSIEKQGLYENLVKGNEKLESKLHLNLHENFVSETYLKTITSLEDAIEWLRHTFFYSRYSSNPTAYDEIPYCQDSDLDGRLMRYCESKLRELIDFKLIKVVHGSYESTLFGDAMTRHYISFQTMKLIIKSRESLTTSEILLLLAKSEEFLTIRLKRTEKKLYKTVNGSPIMRFPLNSNGKKTKNIESSWEKVYLLIQYELGGLEYPADPDFQKVQQAFKQDKFFVFKHLGRIVRCLIDCFIEKKDFISLRNCLVLCRSVSAHGWESTPMVLRQLSGIGLAYVRKFANQGISSFEQISDLEANQIEYYLGLRPGEGNKIKAQVSTLPSFTISSSFVHAAKSKTDSAGVIAKVQVDLVIKSSATKWNNKSLTMNVLCGLSTGELIDFRRAHISKINGPRTIIFDVPLIFQESVFECYISSEEIAGLSESTTLRLFDKLHKPLGSRLKSSDAKEDELEEEDDIDDDLLIQVSNKKPKISVSKSTTRPRNEDKENEQPLKCKHACKDKTKCRHLCCREGLAPKPTKRAKTVEKQQEEPQPSQHKQPDLSGLTLLSRLHSKNSNQYSNKKTVMKPIEVDSQIDSPIKNPILSKFKFHPVSNESPVRAIRTSVSSEDEDITFDALELLGSIKLKPLKTPSSPEKRVESIIRRHTPVEIGSDSTSFSLSRTDTTIQYIYNDLEQVNQDIQNEKEEEELRKLEEEKGILSFHEEQGYQSEHNTDESKFDIDLGSDVQLGSDVEVV